METLKKILSRVKLSPRAWRVIIFSFLGLVAAGATAFTIIYFAVVSAEPDLPYTANLYALNRPQAFTFLDEKGTVVGRRGAIVGERLTLEQMPPYLPAAFLAMEDRHFYEHHGIDVTGMLRAFLTDVVSGHIVQGGSTVTQQLAKILFLSPERTLSRKIDEIADALALEKHLTKQQILELYLNRIYLGSGAYGVDGAAHVYFGKSARKVTVAEAAMLAALTRAPTAFSPRRDLAAAQVRANHVLDSMLATGAATNAQIAEARLNPAEVSDLTEDNARDYFLDTAADEARQVAGNSVGDLVVVTTINTAMQSAARHAVQAVLDKQGEKANASQGALVAMTPDGAVRALIGGRDYAESTFNRITQAHRQPGSSFKVFVYTAALEAGLSPNTTRDDTPVQLGSYTPQNYGGTQWGRLTLTDALAHSVNTIAVNLEQEVGVQSVIAVARRLGITSPLEANASLALGSSDVIPMELTAAYGTFAALGVHPQPYTVLEVRAPTGQTLFKRLAAEPERVMSEDEAKEMNAMLYEVIQSGTGRAALLGEREIAGKTGTTQDYRDAWFIGYSPDLVAGVWVGNDDFSPMKGVTGGGLPAQIWRSFMLAALKNTPLTPLPRAIPEETEATDVTQVPDDEEAAAEDQQQRQEEAQHRREDQHRGFFDWLFGSDRDEEHRPPPRERGSNNDDGN